MKRLFTKHTLAKLKPTFLGLTGIGCVVLVGMALPTNGSQAWSLVGFTFDAILFLISGVMYFFLIFVMGKLAAWGGKLIVYVAGIGGFTTIPVIIESWNMVRDLANMFFIVILLFIAFGTLFRVEAYSWKKLLPKMVFAAILVNFSRAIVGVVVDATQVIMLTFVAAIAPATTQSLVVAFRLNELFALTEVAPGVSGDEALQKADLSSAKVRALSIAVAGMMLGVMVMVEFVYVVVLIGRMAMIWFLTVLSPLGFASMVLPATEKYYKQWWEMLGRYAMVGPMIMFFFWLSMFIAAKTGNGVDESVKSKLGEIVSESELQKITSGPSAADKGVFNRSKALDTQTIVGFLISTMMLMAGLKMAQDNSSELGSIVSKASQVGSWVAKAPLKYGAKPLAGGAIDRVYERTGLDLNVVRQFGRLQEKRTELKRKRELKGRAKAGIAAEKGALVRSWLGAADYGFEHYAPIIGTQGLVKGGSRSQLGRLIFGNRGFQSAKKELDVASGEHKAAEDDYEKTVEGERTVTVTDSHGKAQKVECLSVSEYEQEQKHIKAQQTAAGTLADSVASGNLDLSSPTGTEHNLITTARNELQQERAEKGTSNERKEEINKQIAALDRLMTESGEKVSLSGSAQTALSDTVRKQQEKWRDEAAKYSDKDKVTKYKGQTITDSAHLQSLIADATKDKRALAEEKKEAVKAKAKKVSNLGPVIDYEKTAMQQALLAEANKKFAGEENEDVLMDLLKSKFKEGNGIDALSIVTHAATVGHLNEMMEAMELSQNAEEGLPELAKMIEGLGVSHEMVMAGMNQASTSAKHINHWGYAEAVTQENGQYKWRDEATRQKRCYIEASKVGASTVFQKGNRLALGGYKRDKVTGEQKWNPMPSMMKLLAESLPQLANSAEKGFLNTNTGSFLFTPLGHGLGNVEKLLEEMVRALHKDTGELTKSFRAMKDWKASSAKGEAANDFKAYDAARRKMGMEAYNMAA